MKYLFGIFLLFASLVASASGITVSKAWVAATAPGQQVGGAYMDISSKTDARLVSAQSPVSGKVMIHSMTMKNGIMEMRKMKYLDIPAGKTVSLSPEGMHLMLMKLEKPLVEGQTVPLALIFVQDGKKTEVKVDAKVMTMVHHMEMN